jgi:acetylornithine deacetylase/succinyl-diaminopimelate desuccinylase-like protein
MADSEPTVINPSLARRAFARAAHSILAATMLCAALTLQAHAQTATGAAADPLAAKVRAYRQSHDVEIMGEFTALLAIPNLAPDSTNIRRNAERVIAMLGARGIEGRLLDGPAGAPPAVFGELRTPGATRTIVLYAHYDGQPVDATQWLTPPWHPVLRDKPADAGGAIIPFPTAEGELQGDWRLYARSAGDDKAPIEAMLAALDALKAAGVAPSVNLKFFFEGEEEAGSGHLPEILRRNAPLLAADAWLFCDGPVHQSRRQQLGFGVRGVTGAEITVYGPSHGLHSGHYGNWAPNPVTLLANLVASMRDDDGKILIKSFYDDVAPITAADRAAAESAPPVDTALRTEVQLAATEAHDAPLVDRIMLPALNLRGISGGSVGAAASNTIPTEATASIDFRLVPHQTPDRVRALVQAHVRLRGYFIVDHDPTRAERTAHARVAKITWEAGYPATRVAMDSPLARAVIRATRESLGAPIVTLPTMGGSLPLSLFEDALHTPLIVLPIANHDDNQHAANENLRLQNLFDGIQVFAGVIARVGQYWK